MQEAMAEIMSSECYRCKADHPRCKRCCLPEGVRRFSTAPEHRPEEVGGILARWHDLGHPEVSLGKVRRVAQLPFWLALVTPASQSDIAKVERELGLPPSHAPAQGTLALD